MARLHRNTPLRLTSITCRQASTGYSQVAVLGPVMPAEQTSASIRSSAVNVADAAASALAAHFRRSFSLPERLGPFGTCQRRSFSDASAVISASTCEVSVALSKKPFAPKRKLRLLNSSVACFVSTTLIADGLGSSA